jgi:ATP-dependent DNA helicase DinG
MQRITDVYTPKDLGLPFARYRDGQLEIIRRIVEAFKSNKIVILEAATGVGKSAIGVSVARIMEAKTIITTQTKQLESQYIGAFGDLIYDIRGRGNFQCAWEPAVNCDAAICTVSERCPLAEELGASKWVVCPYYQAKAEAANAPLAITNIFYYLSEVNFVGMLGERGLLIADEGHLLESALMGFVSIDLSRARFSRLGLMVPPLRDIKSVIYWAQRSQERVQTIMGDLTERFERYEARGESAEAGKLAADITNARAQAANLSRVLLLNDQEWIVTNNPYSVNLKPVWATKFGEPCIFSHTEKTLVMSATIRHKEQFCKTLGLDPQETEYIEMPTAFPREHRLINFWPVAKVDKNTDDADYDKIVRAVDAILWKHRHERGVIHTVSYKIADHLSAHSAFAERFITHTSRNREERIQHFMNGEDNGVLVSPSVEIGLDLPDDLGRFGIIVKLPWLSLGDEQVRARTAQDQQWYSWTTACALVQTTGRTTRHERDYSTSYILDANALWFLERNRSLFPKWWLDAIVPARSAAEAALSRPREAPPQEPTAHVSVDF